MQSFTVLLVLGLTVVAPAQSLEADFEDASALLQMPSENKDFPEISSIHLPSIKDGAKKIRDKLNPEGAKRREAAKQEYEFDHRKEIAADMTRNIQKKRDELNSYYDKMDKTQVNMFKKRDEDQVKQRQDYVRHMSDEDIQNLQVTGDKFNQILNSTDPMPSDMLRHLTGQAKTGGPWINGLFQQASAHAAKYGTTDEVRLMGFQKRTNEYWQMAKAGVFGKEEAKIAEEHYAKVEAEEKEKAGAVQPQSAFPSAAQSLNGRSFYQPSAFAPPQAPPAQVPMQMPMAAPMAQPYGYGYGAWGQPQAAWGQAAWGQGAWGQGAWGQAAPQKQAPRAQRFQMPLTGSED